MSELKSNRKDDLSGHLSGVLKYDASRWLGSWHNTFDESRHIIRLDILEKSSKLYIHAFGACEPDPCDWGLSELTLFNSSVESQQTGGFTALYDFGFCQTHLAGMEKQNVLVISTYTTYKDGSNRHNYFLREFYFKK